MNFSKNLFIPNKNITSQLIEKLILNFFGQFISFLILLFLLFNLDIENFGRVSVLLIIIQGPRFILDSFSSLAIESFKFYKKQLNKFFYCAFLSNIFYILVYIFLCLIFLQNFFEYRPSTLIAFAMCMFFDGINTAWFFQLIKKTNKIIFIFFFSRIVSLIYILIYLNNDSLFYLFYGLLIGHVINNIYCLFKIHKIINLSRVNLCNKLIYFFLRKTYKFFISYIENNQFNSLWAIVMSLFINPINFAFYALADQILRVAILFNETFSQILRLNLIHKSKVQINKIINNFVFYSIILFLTSFFVLTIYINFPYSNFYYQTFIYLRFLLFVWFLHALLKIYGLPYLGLLYGYDWLINRNMIFVFVHIFFLCISFLFFKNITYSIIFMTTVILIKLCFYYLAIRKVTN